MTLLGLIVFCAASVVLTAHNVFAGETAIIDGREITVSGSEEAEERFKRYAEAKAKERETKVEDELRLRTKMDSANLGPLKKYVTSRFHHGFDWSVFEKYEYMDTEPLFRLLGDADWVQHWGQAVSVIGAIADKKGAERLIAYIVRDEIDQQHYVASIDAKITAVAALGRTIRRGVYPEGMEFLKAHVSPGSWAETLHKLDISDQAEKRLRKRTLMVLSTIGTEEAVKILEKAREEMIVTYTRGGGKAELKKEDRGRIARIDFFIEEAKRGPLEERNYDH